MKEKETKFDHSEQDIFKACGVDRDVVVKYVDGLPDGLDTKSELVELLCEAGDDPAKNLAIVIAYTSKRRTNE